MKQAAISILLILALSPLTSGAGPIGLKSGEIAPAQANTSSINISNRGPTNVEKHFLVQLEDIPKDEKPEEALEKKGVNALSYVPENTWYASVPVQKISELRKDEDIAFVGKISAENKISPQLEEASDSEELQITVFPDTDRRNVRKQLENIGGEVEKTRYGTTWTLDASSHRIKKLAKKEFVKWIEPVPPSPKTHNSEARAVIGAETVQTRAEYNLTGKGFTAAIWDAGWAGGHEDLNRSGKTIRGDTGHEVRDHGTHVAGTMLGSGNRDSDLRGIAPNASLVTYEWPGTDMSVSEEIYSETEEASETYSAAVSQNSWGWNADQTDVLGNYGSNTADYDNITHGSSHIEPLSIVFSAGNERSGGSNYNTTVGPGATAKNTITVGAVNGNEEPAYYSSWGPTDDGRIKPDLVANGGSYSTNPITSTVPDRYIDIYSDIDCDGNGDDFCYPYAGMQGTSMASPAVSGAVLLLHEQFNRTYNRGPEPTTSKGVLVHTAEDLNRTGPDYITGWGLTNITEAADYVKKSKKKDLIKRDALSQGESHNYSLELEGNNQPNVTLVWNDHPAQPSSSTQLVNDLDLVVTDSSGNRYYPWNLNWSMRTKTATKDRQDRKNNVVQVNLPSDVEEAEIEVRGYNVPEGPQDYTLLLPEQKLTRPSINVISPENQSYNSTSIDLNITANLEVDRAYFSIDGSENSTLERNGEHWNNTKTVGEGRHNVTFYVNNSGFWNSTTEHFTVDTSPPRVKQLKPGEDTNVSGQINITGRASDSLSEVGKTLFSIDGGNHTGDFNTTFNTSKLEEGEHNITFEAVDNAGNTNRTLSNFTVDNTPPRITPLEPSKSPVKDNTSIKANWNDTTTGVNSSTYELANLSGVQRSEKLNDTVNTTKLRDGAYNITYTAEDFSGNNASESTEIVVDNTPPEVSAESFSTDSYLSGKTRINLTVRDISQIKRLEYRLHNTSQNVTRWRNANTTLDTTGFEEKRYSIQTAANDSAGNYMEKTFENITFDNTEPSTNVTPLNNSKEFNGWWKDFREVNVSCMDENALGRIEVLTDETYLSSQEANTTFRLEKSGETDYSFVCSDLAGNKVSENRTFRIDTDKPYLKSSSPANNSEDLDTGFQMDLELTDESEESGINATASRASIDTGEASVTDITNSSMTVDISGLEEGTSYSLEIYLEDNVNRSNQEYISFSTREAETESGDSGGSTDDSSDGSSSTESSTSSGSGSLGNLEEEKEEEKEENEGVFETEYSLSPGKAQSWKMEDKKLSKILDRVSVTVENKTSSTLRIERLEADQKNTYSRLNISTDHAAQTEIRFAVNRSWIEGRHRGPENMFLEEDGDGNKKIETELQEERTETYRYSSRLEEPSVYSIILKKSECLSKSDSAVDPEENSCRQFESPCDVPEDWERVESCQKWREENIRKTINSLRENSTSEEKREILAAAETAVKEGNVSKANQLVKQAESWKPSENGKEHTNMLFLISAAASTVFIAVVALKYFRKRSKENMAEEIDELNEAFEGRNRKLAKAGNEVDKGNYEEAARLLGDFRENVQRQRS